MIRKFLLCPQRRRRPPAQFSWVDHRLVRQGYLARCSPEAAALYLFLVTVGDADGLSYYSDSSIGTHLHLPGRTLRVARDQLLALELIAYQPPLYQVLALDQPPMPSRLYPPTTERLNPSPHHSHHDHVPPPTPAPETPPTPSVSRRIEFTRANHPVPLGEILNTLIGRNPSS